MMAIMTIFNTDIIRICNKFHFGTMQSITLRKKNYCEMLAVHQTVSSLLEKNIRK